MNLDDQIDDLRRLHDVEDGVHVWPLEEVAGHDFGFEPEQQAGPDFAKEDDRRFAEVVHLHKLPGVEEFEQGADAAGRDDHSVGHGHEGVEPPAEPVELLLDVEIRIRALLVRQFDIQPDRLAAIGNALRPGIRRLHQPRPAAGNDIKPLGSKALCDVINIPVSLVPFTDPGRPENSYTIIRFHELLLRLNN